MIKRFKANSYRWSIRGLVLFVLLSGAFLTSATPEGLLGKLGLKNYGAQAAGSDEEVSGNGIAVESAVVSEKEQKDQFIEDWMDESSVARNYKTGLNQGMAVCIMDIDEFLQQLQKDADSMEKTQFEQKLNVK